MTGDAEPQLLVVVWPDISCEADPSLCCLRNFWFDQWLRISDGSETTKYADSSCFRALNHSSHAWTIDSWSFVRHGISLSCKSWRSKRRRLQNSGPSMMFMDWMDSKQGRDVSSMIIPGRLRWRNWWCVEETFGKKTPSMGGILVRWAVPYWPRSFATFSGVVSSTRCPCKLARIHQHDASQDDHGA